MITFDALLRRQILSNGSDRAYGIAPGALPCRTCYERLFDWRLSERRLKVLLGLLNFGWAAMGKPVVLRARIVTSFYGSNKSCNASGIPKHAKNGVRLWSWMSTGPGRR